MANFIVCQQDESLEAVPDEMLSNVAATAESLQPKGFTLSTAEVSLRYVKK